MPKSLALHVRIFAYLMLPWGLIRDEYDLVEQDLCDEPLGWLGIEMYGSIKHQKFDIYLRWSYVGPMAIVVGQVSYNTTFDVD